MSPFLPNVRPQQPQLTFEPWSNAARAASPCRGIVQNELQLVAVLFVPVAADLDEAEAAHEAQRRLVLGADRGDEAMDAVLARVVEQPSYGLGGVAPAAVVREHGVADLDRVRLAPGVHPRRTVEADVADHLVAV